MQNDSMIEIMTGTDFPFHFDLKNGLVHFRGTTGKEGLIQSFPCLLRHILKFLIHHISQEHSL